MRPFAFCLLVFCAGAIAPAQNTFIAHFDSVQMGFNGPASDVVELDDGGFLVGGIQFSSDPFGRIHVFLRRTNDQGNVISENELHHNLDQTVNNGVLGGMVRQDSVLVSGITRYGPQSQETAMYLYKFDQNGDTVSTKPLLHYDTLDSTFVQHRQTILLVNGGYALIGGYDSNSEYRQILLLRVNNIGDTLWLKKYGQLNESDIGYSLTELPDRGFALAGLHSEGNPNDSHTLIRTDSLGNQLWRRQYGNVGGGISSVRASPDSTIITYSQYRSQVQPWFNEDLELRKWDMNGNLIWSKRSYRGTQYCAPMDFEVLADGSIIGSIDYEGQCVIAKWSANGDSLWSRPYAVFMSNFGWTNIPYDIDQTSDGGFVMCGESRQGANDPTPSLQTMFIIKTDSMGCVIPGCQFVGVEEYALNLQEHLNVWPNPVAQGGTVQVQLDVPPGTQLKGEITLVVQDALGREVLHSPLPGRGAGGEATLTLSTTQLSTGIYHLHLRDDKTWLAGSKLVVE